MKKIVALIFLMLTILVNGQYKGKDFSNILNSNNIYELDGFLKYAHPEDPRREVVKPKLMLLIEEYIRNASPDNQRVPKLQLMLVTLKNHPSSSISYEEIKEAKRKKQIFMLQQQIAAKKVQFLDAEKAPNSSNQQETSTPVISSNEALLAKEEAEFNRLMNSISEEEFKQKTTKVLNSLFDNDPSSKETTVMIQNNSNCNMVMKIEGVGNKSYKLPIPKGKQNSIVVEKGDYVFSALVCGVQYASQKKLDKALSMSLGNPRQ